VATVLFVCLHNAGRSQMSAALLERAGGDRHSALSAGTTPAERVHPEVVEVMRELGDELRDPAFDVVAQHADLGEREAGRVGELPVQVGLAGDERTLVTASHGHDDVGPLGQAGVQTPRRPSAEVDADLAHRVHDLRVDAVGGPCARRARLVPAVGGEGEQRLAHLRAAGVVEADEEDVGHRIG